MIKGTGKCNLTQSDGVLLNKEVSTVQSGHVFLKISKRCIKDYCIGVGKNNGGHNVTSRKKNSY